MYTMNIFPPYLLVPLTFLMIGLLKVLINKIHFLQILLSLEFMILSNFLSISWSSSCHSLMPMQTSLMFIILSLSEGAIGFSLLILMTRSEGSDKTSF